MNATITKEIIFTYLAGQATALQKQQLDAWAGQPENEEQFYRWLDEWERTHAQYSADVEPHLTAFRAFAQTQERISAVAEPTALRPVRPHPWVRWAAAATVLLALALGAWLLRDGWFYEIHRTAYNQTRSLRLSDGSQVVLNANSALRLPRYGFGSRTREVYLDGEAEFSVVHTQTHQPFVVKTARALDVVVLGTEFTVFSRPRASKVVLKRGKVRLNYEVRSERRQLTLKPGDVMTLDPEGRARLQTTRRPETHSAWKARRVVFEETPLAEIAEVFEENYGIHLEIPDADMARLTLSGAFTASDADELIRTVTDALGLGYRREGSTIYLTPSASD